MRSALFTQRIMIELEQRPDIHLLLKGPGSYPFDHENHENANER